MSCRIAIALGVALASLPTLAAAQTAAEPHRIAPLTVKAPVDADVRLAQPIEVAYPPQLHELQVPGSVRVRFVVDERGDVIASSVRVLDATHGAFAAAAVRGIRAARFSPAVAGGQPYAQMAQLRVVFDPAIGRAVASR